MDAIVHLEAFLLAATLVIIVPGPATLYVAGRAQHSPGTALRAVAGIVCGDLALIALSGLGFAALLASWPVLVTAIKVVGALYLIYLGWEMLRGDGRVAAKADDGRAGFGRGLLLTLTNPKPILFFAAFFPLFIDPRAGGGAQGFYWLGLWFEAINLAYFATVIFVASRLGRFAGFSSRFGQLGGCALLGCGVFVLASGGVR